MCADSLTQINQLAVWVKSCAIAFIVAITFFLIPSGFAQDQSRIAIIYPQTSGAYKILFDEIVHGIEAELGDADIDRIEISDNADAEMLIERLSRQEADVLIALGSRSYTLAAALHSNKPLIAGALHISPDLDKSISGVSLLPNPKLIFERVRTLSPKSTRVAIIYDVRSEEWFAKLAKQEARAFGIKVSLHEAQNVSDATRHYFNLIRYGNPATDVIWISPSSRLVSENAWPRFVEESWRRRFTLVSGNLSHAETGALFALYPDPKALGRRLAEISRNRLDTPNTPPKIEPLGQTKAALNVKIADHLGLTLSDAEKHNYDLILGER